MAIKDPKEVWRTTLAQIEVKLDSPAQYKTFFQGAKLVDLSKNQATIGVKNGYVHDWLKQKHRDLIETTITHVYGKDLKVNLVVLQEMDQTEPAPRYDAIDSPLLSMQDGLHTSVQELISKSGLNQKYSLGNYVVGDSNRIAHAAALAVIENLGSVYNPLFIHGRTGVGKTHLAQAVGRAVLERNPSHKVIYISSEGFLNEMVKGIKTNRMSQFRAKYRDVNLIILDDIQLISKWIKTQEEFFNTFNELHSNNGQVILVSDRSPSEMKDLEDRLRSRFQGGMVVDISQPEFELRLAILKDKASQLGLQLKPLAFETIARGMIDNVRELEGALQKVALFNQMKPTGDLTIEEIERIIGSDKRTKQEKIKVPTILRHVGKAFGVTVKDMKGPRRTKDVAFARQVAMFILREEFGYKLDEVANFLLRKDHTTVMHAVDRINSKILTTEGFKQQIVQIIKELQDSTLVQT